MLAILFDVDDTLYDVSIPFCSACDKVFKERYSIPSMDLFLAGRIHDIPVVDRIRKAFSKFGIQITESEVKESLYPGMKESANRTPGFLNSRSRDLNLTGRIHGL